MSPVQTTKTLDTAELVLFFSKSSTILASNLQFFTEMPLNAATFLDRIKLLAVLEKWGMNSGEYGEKVRQKMKRQLILFKYTQK